MNSRLSAIVFLAAANAAGGAMAAELNCPAFPEPRNVKLQWVAPYMLYNGVPMSVKRFDTELNAADILAFYRKTWGGGPANTLPVENEVPPWQTIGVARGKCFYTVQVQPTGLKGSTGMLSVTEAPDKSRIVSQPLPMMSGSKVINDIEHRDDGKSARTLLLSNSFSADSNADFYRQTMADQGWHPVSGYRMETKRGPGITLIMKRGLAEVSLVITRSGSETTVLANLVDRP
jgi:hypothetical protein